MSFWATLKRECDTTIFENRSQAQAAIFECVMVFFTIATTIPLGYPISIMPVFEFYALTVLFFATTICRTRR